LTLAVDASVITKIYFPEKRSERARALMDDALESDERVLAPRLLAAEFVNVARKKMRRDGVSLDEAVGAIDRFLRL